MSLLQGVGGVLRAGLRRNWDLKTNFCQFSVIDYFVLLKKKKQKKIFLHQFNLTVRV